MKKSLSVLSTIVLLLSACGANWLADRNEGVAMSFLLAGSVLATGWLIYRFEVKRMKTCKFCKKPFSGVYEKQHFCSQYCAQQSIFKKAFFTEAK